MNAAEKNVLYIAVALFVMGCFFRIVPWGLPSIEVREEFSLFPESTDKLIPANANLQDSSGIAKLASDKPFVEGSKKDKKGKAKQKKIKPKVKLPLKINQAGIDELCALKGVGPKLAEKIFEVRTRNGPFKSPDDLKKVPGIGKKKLEGILQGVIFD